MLRFSKKADYAILLLSHLALDAGRRDTSAADEKESNAAEKSSASEAIRDGAPSGLRSAHELAEATGLGDSLTANILKAYSKAGILASVRGAHGGYRLDRDPGELSLREILEVVEGPLHLVDCVEHGFDTSESCSHAGVCPSRGPLQALQERIYAMLDRLPLSELAQQQASPSLPSQV